MSRHNPEPAMGLPWRIDLCPDRLGGGYLIKGSSDDKVRIYGTRADADLIIHAVNSLEEIKTLRAENARYREALEIVAEGEAHPLRYYQLRDLAREALKGE